jgi:hypothetical protein
MSKWGELNEADKAAKPLPRPKDNQKSEGAPKVTIST